MSMCVCKTVLCAYSTEPFFCIHSILKSNANSRLYICFVVVSFLFCCANAYSFSLWMFLTYKFYLDKRLCMVFTDDFFDCNAHCEWKTSTKTTFICCFFFQWFIYNFSLRYYWEQSDLNLNKICVLWFLRLEFFFT